MATQTIENRHWTGPRQTIFLYRNKFFVLPVLIHSYSCSFAQIHVRKIVLRTKCQLRKLVLLFQVNSKTAEHLMSYSDSGETGLQVWYLEPVDQCQIAQKENPMFLVSSHLYKHKFDIHDFICSLYICVAFLDKVWRGPITEN